MEGIENVKPRLSLLSAEQIQEVHEHSLKILSSVGVRVDSNHALKLMVQAIGEEQPDTEILRIPRELVEWAIRKTPASVDVYERKGALAFSLPGPARFGIGVTCLNFQRPETGEVVPFSREHMGMMVRLGNALKSYDVISTVGVIQDVSHEVSDLYATLEMIANTEKPLVLLISKEDVFPSVLDLLDELHGNLAERPFIIPYLNPITPLVINQGTVDKMVVAIERGLPVIYSNYGMAGASTPITQAGQLALLNAELLAGLTLAQLIKEGTPVILGNLPAVFDMRGVGSFYDPKSFLLDIACAEMMASYCIPHAGTSGSGVGAGADLVASGSQWLNHLVSCVGKIGLAPFVGDCLGSVVFSPEIIVYADDIIKQARLFGEGFSLSKEDVGFEEIAQAGPGGEFLTSDRTLKLARKAYHRSNVFDHMTLDKWQERGCPRSEDMLREYTLDLMADSRPPEDQQDLLERGESFIRHYHNNR